MALSRLYWQMGLVVVERRLSQIVKNLIQELLFEDQVFTLVWTLEGLFEE